EPSGQVGGGGAEAPAAVRGDGGAGPEERGEGGGAEEEAAGGALQAGGQHRLRRPDLDPGRPTQLEQRVSGGDPSLPCAAGRDALTLLWLSRRRTSRRVRELWWQGVPPSVRGRVWSLAVGNELN
ncbi:unnamed protein product, partial [Tetraodon nigroviridis]